jgi:hypothetical protein
MPELAAMAERLRKVKQSYEHFLALWALDRLLTRPVAIDRFQADINNAIDDPHNRDWSMMYRGDVLDD